MLWWGRAIEKFLLFLRWFNHERSFTIVSLVMAVVFAWGFFQTAGFPPVRIEKGWPTLLFFLVFFLLPFAKKVDFFQFFSFEAKLSEVKKEVSDQTGKLEGVQTDLRHIITQQNALTASFQSLQQQAVTVNNNYPGVTPQQAEDAKEAVAGVEPDPAELQQDEALQSVLQSVWAKYELGVPHVQSAQNLSDMLASLDSVRELRQLNASEQAALLRVRVEAEIKRLLAPHFESDPQGRRAGYNQLLKLLFMIYPELKDQAKSFTVFYRIASAAIHADEIPYRDLQDSIYIGQRLLTLLLKTETKPVQWPNDDDDDDEIL
jgi:hypothetical protein